MRLSTVQIAWRNLGRSRRRTVLVLLAIAIGQFGLLASQGLMRGYADGIYSALTGPMLGHVQIHHPEWREERAMDLVIRDLSRVLQDVRSTAGVSSASARVHAPTLIAPERDAYAATVVGVDIDVERSEYGLLPGLEADLGEDRVLLGHRLARRTGAQAGQEIALIGQAADGSYATGLFTVEAVVRTPVNLINESGVVMPLARAQELFVLPDQAHEVVVRGETGVEARPLAQRLAELSSLQDLEVKTWQELVPQLVMIVDMVDYMGYFVLALVFVAVVAGIANTLMMATFERMHELGMLLALGTHPGRLVRMILSEAVLLGVFGVLVGTAFGVLFVAATAGPGIDMASWGGEAVKDLSYQGLNFPLLVHPRIAAADVFAGFVAVVLTAVVAALWPAAVTARLEPMEAMRA